jgi:UDP-glucuronate 4-epimerase
MSVKPSSRATILVTGAAGFIGFHLAKRLLDDDYPVIGLDNLNDYYDVQLKKDRLQLLKKYKQFEFYKIDLADRDSLENLFQQYAFSYVINLAAQAGVRHSITHPHDYVDANLVGFVNLIECCRHHNVKHLVYASTSSVYGANQSQPFSEAQGTNHPLALYAATKKANELIAHSYSHLYQLPSTGLRFFTVYGPWGRPDMALFKFTKNILEAKPIDVYNHGDMIRDFTYVDDIVEGIYRTIFKVVQPDSNWDGSNPNPGSSYAPYRIYNIGNNKPIQLMDFIRAIEKALNKQAKLNYMPMQPGDVPATDADVTKLARDLNYHPQVGVDEGVKRFINWYREYYEK